MKLAQSLIFGPLLLLLSGVVSGERTEDSRVAMRAVSLGTLRPSPASSVEGPLGAAHWTGHRYYFWKLLLRLGIALSSATRGGT